MSEQRPVILVADDEPGVVRALSRILGSQHQLLIASDGGMAVLRVRDRGIGIPVIEHKHVFEPFFRCANTGGISGTGLGLAITRNAIDLHQGEISFESEEGQGTIFTVRLPLAAAQDTPA